MTDYQDNLEGAGMAPAVDVAFVAVSSRHRLRPIEIRGNGYPALVAGDGIPHQELEPSMVEDKDAAVAEAEEPVVVVVVEPQGEARECFK